MLFKKIKTEDCRGIRLYPMIKKLRANPVASMIWKDDFKVDISLLHDDKEFIELFYLCNLSEEFEEAKHPITLRIKLSTTKCHIAGKRFWFVCPLANQDGKPCNKLCSVLYKPENQIYFACRDCYNLTYASRSSRHRKFITACLREAMEKELRTKFYNLQPTRRYLAIKEKIRKNHEGVSKMLELANKKRMGNKSRK